MGKRQFVLGFVSIAVLILVGISATTLTRRNDVNPSTDDATPDPSRQLDPMLSVNDSAALESGKHAVGLNVPARTASLRGFIGLSGRVIEAESGQPIAGAAIYLKLLFRHMEAEIDGEVTEAQRRSAKDGTFRFEKLIPGKWACVVWHSGFVTPGASASLVSLLEHVGGSPFMLDVPTKAKGEIRKTYKMSRGRVVRGRVLDQDGKGVPSAEIRFRLPKTLANRISYEVLSSLNTITSAHAPTLDRDGSFTLGCIPPQVKGIHIAAYSKGYACKYVPVDGDKEVTLLLLPCAVVRGRVIDLHGNVARGATVDVTSGQWTSSYDWEFDEVQREETSEHGAFELKGLPPTDCHVSACWNGPFNDSSQQVEGLRPNETRLGIELQVGARARTFNAQVLGPKGKPCPQATIWVQPLGVDNFAEDLDEIGHERLTDESGHVSITTRLQDPIEFLHTTEDATHVLKHIGTTPHGELQLKTPATVQRIDVHVRTANGQAVPTFELEVRRGDSVLEYLECEDGSKGKVSSVLYETPPFSIHVSHARGPDGSLLKPQARVVSAEDLKKPIEFVLARAGPRRLRVLDSNGHPLPGVSVGTTRSRHKTSRKDVTPIIPDADRAFPLPSIHGYLCLVVSTPAGFVPVSIPYDQRSYYEPIVPVAAGAVAGRVVFPESSVKSHPMVLLATWQSRPTDPYAMAIAVSIPVDEITGTFRSEQIPLDRVVRIQPEARALRKLRLAQVPPLEVRAGQTDIELRLKQGKTIRGEISAFGKKEDLSVFAQAIEGTRRKIWGKVNADGSFVIEGIAHEPHRVILLAEHPEIYLAETTVTENRRIRFDVGHLASLRVRHVGGDLPELWIWDANSNRIFGSGSQYNDDDEGTMDIVLPAKNRYDIVLIDISSIGYKLNVGTGDAIEFSTSPPLTISGTLSREAKKHDMLLFIPSRKGPRFACHPNGSSFQLDVLPGQYNVALQTRDGTTTTIARVIQAGDLYVKLQLPSPPEKTR